MGNWDGQLAYLTSGYTDITRGVRQRCVLFHEKSKIECPAHTTQTNPGSTWAKLTKVSFSMCEQN